MVMKIYAAGSLKRPLIELSAIYDRGRESSIDLTFGASGLLRRRLENGDAADLFVSADKANAQQLIESGHASGAMVFATNELCALTLSTLGCTSDTLLDHMLDPDVRVGSSTPRLDPSGDYADYAFWHAETLRKGAYETLRNKVQILTGGGEAVKAPTGRYTYTWIMEQGLADIFLTYRTNATRVQEECQCVTVVPLPPELAVKARYTIAGMKHANPRTHEFIDLLMSDSGRQTLKSFGFGV